MKGYLAKQFRISPINVTFQKEKKKNFLRLYQKAIAEVQHNHKCRAEKVADDKHSLEPDSSAPAQIHAFSLKGMLPT